MSLLSNHIPPVAVVVEGYLVDDVRWLVMAVEEFAGSGDIGAVKELLRFADPNLSADGLANVAGHLAILLSDHIEEAR
ncbi:MAG: hypothetical protein ACRD0I_12650 [Acidimicrobiales bacterium]